MADPAIDTVPEDEELEMDEDFGGDMLLSVLTTDDGESITSVLANIAASTEAIAKQFEKQNLILVKILSALTSMKGCECKAAEPKYVAAPA
jgi:hypothetical protein